MKKTFFLFLVAIAIFHTGFLPLKRARYKVPIQMTCEFNPIGIDSVYADWDGEMFNYSIKYCSQAFNADARYVKFELVFVDSVGNILQETADGPKLGKENNLKKFHTVSVGIAQEPYDCIIKWFYKDVNAEELIPSKSDPNVTYRVIPKEETWQLVSIRALKLFRYRK